MTMLEGWIYRGQLDDPYHEFMVREEQGLAKENVEEDFNAAYWDKRCVLCCRLPPPPGVLGLSGCVEVRGLDRDLCVPRRSGVQ